MERRQIAQRKKRPVPFDKQRQHPPLRGRGFVESLDGRTRVVGRNHVARECLSCGQQIRTQSQRLGQLDTFILSPALRPVDSRHRAVGSRIVRLEV